MLWLLAPQPIYSGPTAVESFTPQTFKEAVLDNPEPGTAWLVRRPPLRVAGSKADGAGRGRAGRPCCRLTGCFR